MGTGNQSFFWFNRTLDIREALYYFGEITGEVTNDELLGNILLISVSESNPKNANTYLSHKSLFLNTFALKIILNIIMKNSCITFAAAAFISCNNLGENEFVIKGTVDRNWKRKISHSWNTRWNRNGFKSYWFCHN